jgi:hypothetical protein
MSEAVDSPDRAAGGGVGGASPSAGAGSAGGDSPTATSTSPVHATSPDFIAALLSQSQSQTSSPARRSMVSSVASSVSSHQTNNDGGDVVGELPSGSRGFTSFALFGGNDEDYDGFHVVGDDDGEGGMAMGAALAEFDGTTTTKTSLSVSAANANEAPNAATGLEQVGSSTCLGSGEWSPTGAVHKHTQTQTDIHSSSSFSADPFPSITNTNTNTNADINTSIMSPGGSINSVGSATATPADTSESSSISNANKTPIRSRPPRRASFDRTSFKKLGELKHGYSMSSILENLNSGSSSTSQHHRTSTGGNGGSGSMTLAQHRRTSSVGSSAPGSRTTSSATARRTSPSISNPTGTGHGHGGHQSRTMNSAMMRRMSPSQDNSTSSGGSGGNQGNNALKQIRAQGMSVLSTIIPGLGNNNSNSNPAETYGEDYMQDHDAALGTLGSGQATDWESMAAAAAIVSGGTTATDARNQHRYNVGDRVLVVANANNKHVADTGDLEGGMDGGGACAAGNQIGVDRSAADGVGDDIVAPVNKHGFPVGKGDMEEERRGPYVYVLSCVRKVHFEEDARYYTVTREDTGRDQRADTGESSRV